MGKSAIARAQDETAELVNKHLADTDTYDAQLLARDAYLLGWAAAAERDDANLKVITSDILNRCKEELEAAYERGRDRSNGTI